MSFEEKKKEMMVKYEKAINAIAEANNCDVGVAFERLVANLTRGGLIRILVLER